MSFDPIELPEKEWLKLSEVVNFLALGEALHATDQVAADRTYLPEIGAALERCRNQTRDGTRSAEHPQLFWHSNFLELVGNDDSYAPFPPSSAQLDRCKIAWPPYGQHLYDLVVAWERAHEQDNHRRAEAEQKVLQWLLSGEVEFDGMIVVDDRRGCRERIDVDHIFDPVIFWGHDRIAAQPRHGDNSRPDEPRPMLVWDEVQIKRSSLVRWLRPPPPDAAKFDPMQEPYWTLPMAVAWVRSKSADAVREQWAAWLEQCLERRIHEDGHYYLEPRQKASLAELITTSPENHEAWEPLRQALQNGELTATAFHAATGKRVCVPASAWAISEDQAARRRNTGPMLRQPCAPLPDENAYTGILLKCADVLKIWPIEPSAVGQSGAVAVKEKKKRGPKPYYSEEAIVMIARHVAKRPKVPGVTPANEKLIDETRNLHKRKWPKSRKPSRSTVQRTLDKHGWP